MNINNIEIPAYINTETYFTKKRTSVTFIYNLKETVHYVLLGYEALLWNFILEFPDYSKILDFSIKHNQQENLNDFLVELKNKKLILTDILFPEPIKKHKFYSISQKSRNVTSFNENKVKFISNSGSLVFLRLCLNYTCNLNCRHCCNPKNIFDEMSYEQAKNIIDEAIKLGVSHVDLTGGECTLNKDFLKIAKYVRSKFLALRIFTNAQKLFDDKEMFDEIVSIYPSDIQISLYSMDKNVHDNLTRVSGSYDKTVDVITRLRKYNLNVGISCFQTSSNRNSYSDVKKFASSIGCGIRLSCRFQYNPNNDNLKEKLSFEDMEKFYFDTIDLNNVRKNKFKCTAGNDRLEILPNLDVNPCNYCYYFLGNYNNVSLENIRKTTVQDFLRPLKKENLKECFKYEYCEYCKYCPAFNCYDKDGFLKKSEILCEDARAYYSALKRLQNQ